MIPLFSRGKYKTLNTVYVSRSAILHNHNALQRLHPKAYICPVLKSNAYGCGLQTVAPIFDSLHAPFLIVDSLYEAYELSKIHAKTPVLILGYTSPANLKHKKLPFHFTVYEETLLEGLIRFQPHIPIHLFVDTGMCREGIPLSNLRTFIRRAKTKGANIVGLASHFADADNSTSDIYWKRQLTKMKEALMIMRSESIEPTWKHLSASAGTFKLHDPEFNMIRAGLISYGISPLGEQDSPDVFACKPIARFCSTLVQVKTITKGSLVGYNGTYQVKQATKIGIISAGYYEGVDRRLSNIGFVKVCGMFCPIIGRVSMNMTTIDLSLVPNVRVGDEIEIYSDDPLTKNSFVNVAKLSKTIPYELLVHIAESVRRTIVE